MSQWVFVDTDVIVGAQLENDSNHSQGRQIFESIDNGDLPTALVSEYVFLETINYLVGKRGVPHDFVNEVSEKLQKSNNFRLIPVETKHFHSAKNEICPKYPKLSFTDSSIVAMMDDLDMDYIYSLDGGFDSVDSVIRLNVARSPY